MILQVLIGIVFTVVILIFVFLWFGGFFTKLTVVEKEMGPYTFAYQEFIGPYSKTKNVFEQVYKILVENSITSEIGIGIYFDDPKEVPADKLKSHCGSVITEEEAKKLQGKLQTDTIPKGKAIVVDFPYKSVLSYMVGPMRVYPVLSRYALEKGYAQTTKGIEVYDIPNKVLYYYFEI
jgi:hypothetical protein